MIFEFIVEVELERDTGKFASRAELEKALGEMLDDAFDDVYGVGADGDSTYNLVNNEWQAVDRKMYVQP